MSKFLLYVVLSWGLFAFYVTSAYFEQRQYFPTVMALSNSKAFNAILTNSVFCFLLVCGYALMKIFFGKLREAERENMQERFSYHVVETCIGLTYFRGSLTASMTSLFVICAIAKMIHVVAVKRQEHTEHTPRISKPEVFRLILMTACFFVVDLFAVVYYTNIVLKDGFGSAVVLLSLEWMLMLINLVAVSLKVLLHQIEMFKGNSWEAKGVLKFYVEIMADLTSSAAYVTFFGVMCRQHTLPLHLFRELGVHIRKSYVTCHDFLNYRNLVAKMDKTFTSPTTEELEADRTCVICYDEMESIDEAKKLPCNHCFHRHCLRRWLERNSTCPYCRGNIIELAAAAAVARQAAGTPPAADQAVNAANAPDQNTPGMAPATPGRFPSAPATPASPPSTPADVDSEVLRAYQTYQNIYREQSMRSERSNSSMGAPQADASPAPAQAAPRAATSPKHQALQRQRSEERVASLSTSTNATKDALSAYAEYEEAVRKAQEELQERLKQLSNST